MLERVDKLRVAVESESWVMPPSRGRGVEKGLKVRLGAGGRSYVYIYAPIPTPSLSKAYIKTVPLTRLEGVCDRDRKLGTRTRSLVALFKCAAHSLYIPELDS